MQISNEKTKYKIIFIVVELVMCLRCCGVELATSLTTSLAFSYQYGFGDGGFVGSIYQLLCNKLLGVALDYESAFIFSAIVMMISVILFCVWGCKIVDNLYSNNSKKMFVVLIVFTIFSASIFTGADYIGSAETIMLIITLVDMYVIATDGKLIWMILLPLLGIIVGSTYLFAFMGCVIVLLIASYYIRKDNKYKISLIINSCEAVGIYIYYLIVGGVGDKGEIYELALQLSSEEKVKSGLLDYYVSGIGACWSGFPQVHVALLRIIVILLLSIPFIVLAIVIYKKILTRAKDTLDMPLWVYKTWGVGGLFISPLFIISNNYGTWFFAIVAYYLLTTLGFILMNNNTVIQVLKEVLDEIYSKYKWLVIVLIYTVFFTPIDSVKVCQFVDSFIKW